MVEKRMVSARIKRKIHLRDNFTCYYCGEAPTEKDIRLDHIIPYSKGGKSDIWNVITACKMCNARKGTTRLPNEEEVLNIVKERNILHELDKEDVLNAPNKKVYSASRTGNIEGRTYNYPRDYEVIIHVTLGEMTNTDKKIALEVLLKGDVVYDREGDAETVCLSFDRDYFTQVTGINIEDLHTTDNLRFFSLNGSKRPVRYSHTVKETFDGGGWCSTSLTLMRSIKYNRETSEFIVTMCLTNTDKFIDAIIEDLVSN